MYKKYILSDASLTTLSKWSSTSRPNKVSLQTSFTLSKHFSLIILIAISITQHSNIRDVKKFTSDFLRKRKTHWAGVELHSFPSAFNRELRCQTHVVFSSIYSVVTFRFKNSSVFQLSDFVTWAMGMLLSNYDKLISLIEEYKIH